MKKAILIYPHQLFENNKLISNNKDSILYIVEDPLFFKQYNFHKQKLILHRASMKFYADYLTSLGQKVIYIDHIKLSHTSGIVNILLKDKVLSIKMYDPVDDWLEKRLKKSLSENSISYEFLSTPLFLTEKEDFVSFFDARVGNKKYFMFEFYKWQRVRLGILINENNKPEGGSWSYDEENRKKLPKDIVLPYKQGEYNNKYVTEAKKYIKKYFPNNYGQADVFYYPIDFKDAKKVLHDFLKYKLKEFGPYEDAITQKHQTLFHSVLSPLLNNGLLTPEFVIKETLSYHDKNHIPLASLEGFIRQIIGWREYMRAIYVLEGRNIRTKNYFKAEKNIPKSFWQGDTGVKPVDNVIKHTLENAYSHHIERLMIMGNFMNLCGFEPNQIYKWFMEMYIDAYDWVMVPNVYSMALYADGGIITTKPYIAGSNYILKMSDYKAGDEWCFIWDSLFWNFVNKHYKLLEKEGRLGFIGITFSKMNDEKKDGFLGCAEGWLGNMK